MATGAQSPSLVDDVPPNADSEVDDEFDEFDEDDSEMEAIAETNAMEQDADTLEPWKYMERSLKYQNLRMTLRHAKERLEFNIGFAKQMSSKKQPGKQIAIFKKRVDRADKCLEDYTYKYAEARRRAHEKRGDMCRERKKRTADEKQLNKVVRDAIKRETDMRKALATKAALAAVEALGKDATEEEKNKVQLEAFTEVFKNTPTDSASVTTQDSSA